MYRLHRTPLNFLSRSFQLGLNAPDRSFWFIMGPERGSGRAVLQSVGPAKRCSTPPAINQANDERFRVSNGT